MRWPLGWLSDRRDRAWLIRACAILLCLFALPLALLQQMPLALLLALGIAASMLQFTLYPLAVAFSNDHVETERRVSLTAMLLVTFGVGACIGPLAAGALMRLFGANMLYAFVSACALILVWRVHPEKVSGLHRVDDAPLHHVPTPDNMTSSPLVAALDPRVDEQAVQEQMVDGEPDAPQMTVRRRTELRSPREPIGRRGYDESDAFPSPDGAQPAARAAAAEDRQAIGEESAGRLQRVLLERALRLPDRGFSARILWFDDDLDSDLQALAVAVGWSLMSQPAGDPGERMRRIAALGLAEARRYC